jgi:non-ribosomal peptide synthetase component E (peptide arylation enzyme)
MKYTVSVLTEFSWLRTQSSGGLLGTRKLIFRVHNRGEYLDQMQYKFIITDKESKYVYVLILEIKSKNV